MVAADETKKETTPEQNVQSEDKKGKKKKDKKQKVIKELIFHYLTTLLLCARSNLQGELTLGAFKKELSLSVCKWLDLIYYFTVGECV